MLDICLGEKDATTRILKDEERISCDVCYEEAFIFQEEGNFCLQCWQARTEPDITVKDNNANDRQLSDLL